MELGSVTLKRIGFFCFPIKHSTHTRHGGTRGNPVGVAIRSREDHSDEKITHHEVGWSPLRNHPINVRGGQVSAWEESQMLAALAVSELPAALQ